MRILVAEDEFIIRLCITEALSDAGFEVIPASCGQMALKLIKDPDHIVAVVTDFHMPGADGIAVAHCARQRHLGIPVVFMTARPDLLSECKIEPPCVYLSKPFSVPHLIGTVEQALKRSD
jgi:DNA-binding NtrC family response regulator